MNEKEIEKLQNRKEDWEPRGISPRYAVILCASVVVIAVLLFMGIAGIFSPGPSSSASGPLESDASVAGSLERIDEGAEAAFETRPPLIDPRVETDAARVAPSAPARQEFDDAPAPDIKPYIPRD